LCGVVRRFAGCDSQDEQSEQHDPSRRMSDGAWISRHGISCHSEWLLSGVACEPSDAILG
jgi:hypothetical protein